MCTQYIWNDVVSRIKQALLSIFKMFLNCSKFWFEYVQYCLYKGEQREICFAFDEIIQNVVF